MQRKSFLIKLLAALLLIVAATALGSFFVPNASPTAAMPGALTLQRPAFLGIAHAQDVTAATSTGTFLDKEAAMSAYFKTDGPIDLASIHDSFTTIEVETGDYIIGSMSVPNYNAETEQVHVYVHKDGWVLTYYPQDAPASKSIDLATYTNDHTVTTKLRNLSARIAQTVGSSFSDVSYYDFLYPNATQMMVVVEIDDSNGNSFKIQLPSSYAYYERSWADRGTAMLPTSTSTARGSAAILVWIVMVR